MGFLVVIETKEQGYSAYAPDFDGCVASGRTREQVERQIRAVIEFQCVSLRLSGRELPVPTADHVYMELGSSDMEVRRG